MKECKKCFERKDESMFYSGDSSCKECRKDMVRKNRARNIEYYRAYDKKRFKEDPKVKERHVRYLSTENGKKKSLEAKKRWEKSNSTKRYCYRLLQKAINSGVVIRPSNCESCNKSCVPHGHHDDYLYPLSVRWLCAKCHTNWHLENGPGKNA